MSSEIVFARKASGLVREASLLDTVFFGIMNNGTATAVWYFYTSAFYLFPGTNMIITFIIGSFLAILGLSIAWGILGATMPRSGGEYIYNSRILHPLIGVFGSFGSAFVWIAWIWVLAPWIADPGLRIFAGAMGWDPEIFSWAYTSVGMYVISTVANIIAFLIVLRGLKVYLRIQRILVGWSLVAVIIAAIILSVTSYDAFASTWNSLAVKYGSPTWSETVNLVKESFTIPTTWNWESSIKSLLPLAWGLIYAYIIAYVGGEVKSPKRNIFLGHVISAMTMIILMAWVGLALQRLLGFEGIHVLAYVDYEVPEWYKMPFPPTFLNLAAMLTGFNIILGILLGLAFIFADFLYIPSSYIAFSRELFAWGMDRLGPSWFTDVNPRYHQPLKLLVLAFVLMQIGITWYVVQPDVLAGFSPEIMELMFVFGLTMISATLLPFRGKIAHIWEASPYKSWRIGSIPYATIAGILGLVFVGTVLWSAFSAEGLESILSIWSYLYVAAGVLGITWYFAWKQYWLRQGIDLNLLFKELAPE